MSYIRQYMQNARNFANENYLNADGFIDDDTNYFTGNEDYFSADGMPMASMPQASAPVSQPYIVTVSNASATAVSSFDILGAYTYLSQLSNGSMASSPAGTVNFTSGNMVVTNTGGAGTGFAITVSSGISNVTYQQFLYQSMNSPFTVGMTYIQSTNSTQLTNPITVNTQDANGNQALKTLVVTIDPYQQQTSVVAVKQVFRIDGYTKLTTTVLGSQTTTYQFYPADNINLARGLSGRAASRQFTKPSIVKDSVAVIGGDMVKARLG
jgi:hypothetical protein